MKMNIEQLKSEYKKCNDAFKKHFIKRTILFKINENERIKKEQQETMLKREEELRIQIIKAMTTVVDMEEIYKIYPPHVMPQHAIE